MPPRKDTRKRIGGYPAVYIYRGTWKCGCQYIGQSNHPTTRWWRHKKYPANWAIKDHHETWGTPNWEIIGNPGGYEAGPVANRAEGLAIDWAKKHGGPLLNRFGNNWGQNSGRGPIGRPFDRPDRPRKYPRSNRTQKCRICHQYKAGVEFDADRNRSTGLASLCKVCAKIKRAKYPAYRDGYQPPKYPRSTKPQECSVCLIDQPARSFWADNRIPTGLRRECATCLKAMRKTGQTAQERQEYLELVLA